MQATKVLNSLGMWEDCVLPGGLQAWRINESFRINLKVALLGGYVNNHENILFSFHVEYSIQTCDLVVNLGVEAGS